MKWLWAIVVAAILVIAGMYFRAPPPSIEQPAIATQAAATAKAGPHPVYRWRDAAGVLQITDVPPTDRPYERVQLRADQNIVSLRDASEEKPDNKTP